MYEPVPLIKKYTIAWMVLFCAMTINEFFIPIHLTGIIWDIIFSLVLIVELIAVFTPEDGDTLSEHVWAFQTGWARSFLIGAGVIWLCINFTQIGSAEPSLGRIILSIGLGAWLLIHWIWKGKYG